MDKEENIKESNPKIKFSEEQFSDFIEAAAHDLQAPLRKLSVLIERVFTKNEGQFDDDAKQYINRIETCIDEMRSLIDGLMELTKVDTATTVNTSCDLNVIVSQTLESIREEIEEKHVLIQIDSLPVVQGNTVQYKQLFKNLFENAIKFGKKDSERKIEITAGLATMEEKTQFDLVKDKKYHKIEIIDNGIGFKQALAEKIFEPFVRLFPKSQYKGNGLGLFICKKIVFNHHGIIYAKGDEKIGSRFVLILPETP
jgi:hypothetical protein